MTVTPNSEFELPNPIYQMIHSGDAETEGAVYEGCVTPGVKHGDRNISDSLKQGPITNNKDFKGAGESEPKNRNTDRVVRNFKPSKTRRLPDLQRDNEKRRMSQLADSNMTPLGLFN